ncbi:hypothetical protein DSO57_1025650 [Entomophthora muscae]|uniref:Uncharacterized protein n=1 Tax=Entomophthora muscae TaxID=34485 RepID=A0ACC2RTB9_9FUNG|nr:hypothetical protein DSO57_1025650 [Entomophthora muscae]
MKLAFGLIGLAACFQYGVEKVRGVNLGGWLVLEPWITPSVFEQFQGRQNPAVDEWTFCEVLGREEAERQLRRHWESWVTEGDLARLAAAGINHVRIPVGYWAVDIKNGEPWVKGSFDYLIKGVHWAKNHGIRVIIDIHGAPGSQNGFDNSGKRDGIRFFDDYDNIRRMLNVAQVLSEHFARPEFGGMVAGVQLVNEPAGWQLDRGTLQQFYSDGYDRVRGNSKEMLVVVHDAFVPLRDWEYLRNDYHQRVMLDTHIYQVFDYGLLGMSKQSHLQKPCTRWGEIANSNQKLWTVVGEFSLASTDCTRWLNGFNRGARYDGTFEQGRGPVCPGCTCQGKDDLGSYTTEHREFLKNFARQQMGVYETAGSGWFFWNFKAEKSPEWDFLLGVEQGWINLHQGLTPSC